MQGTTVFLMGMGNVPDCVELKRSGVSDAELEWAYARGEVDSGEAIPFEIIGGTVFPDVIWSGFYLIVSEAVWRVMQTEAILGCRAYPCRLVPSPVSIPSYFVLGITGRCREISFGDGGSGKRRVRMDGKGRRLVYALLDVDFTEWDGTDLFMSHSKRTAHRCVSQIARLLFERHRISGVRFDAVEECEMFVDIE